MTTNINIRKQKYINDKFKLHITCFLKKKPHHISKFITINYSLFQWGRNQAYIRFSFSRNVPKIRDFTRQLQLDKMIVWSCDVNISCPLILQVCNFCMFSSLKEDISYSNFRELVFYHSGYKNGNAMNQKLYMLDSII